MKDIIHVICAVISFILAITVQICLGIWLANIGPITVDKKASWHTSSLLPDYHPVINNISLLLLFALQHSLMARKTFGAIITTYLPEGFEKIVYSMATIVIVLLMCLLWEPLPNNVWHVTIPWLRYSITIIRVIFLVLLVRSIVTLDSRSLFGIKQPLSRFRNEEPSKTELVTTGAYGIVRHPSMSCFIGVFLIMPTMSVGHLLFSVSMVIYIVLSVLYLEERDLLQQFGSQYETYRKTTPAFIPSLWRSKPAKD